MGFQMVTYPATVLFRVTKMTQRALRDLKDGWPLPRDDSVDFETFEKIVDKDLWAGIEARFGKG